MFYVNKTYGHEQGFTTCFRQPFANSHCRDPHGYPLSFRLRFGAERLDQNNWVIDFGGLKPIKSWLSENFDHRTVLARNDPALEDFRELYVKHGFREPLVIPFVGCEGFAKYVFDYVQDWISETHPIAMDVRGLHIAEVEVREHGANSATYTGNN